MTDVASCSRAFALLLVTAMCPAGGLCSRVLAAGDGQRDESEKIEKTMRENLLERSNYELLLRNNKHHVRLWQTTKEHSGITVDAIGAARVYTGVFAKTDLTIPTSAVRDLIVHSAENGNKAKSTLSSVSGATDDDYRGRQLFIQAIVIKDNTVAPELVKEIAIRYKVKLPYVLRLALHEDGNLYANLVDAGEKKQR